MTLIIRLLNFLYEFFSLIVFVRVIISLIPNINYYREPVRTIVNISDWILEPIRNLLDRYNLLTAIDISPIIALFLLRLAYKVLLQAVLFIFFI